MERKVLILAILSMATIRVYGWTSTICNAGGLQLFPLIVPNQKSDKGAIICWVDQRESHFEIYAKEINGSDGSTASGWDSNGDEVSRPPHTFPYAFTPNGHRLSHEATYGNEGEIIIAWVNHHSLVHIVGTDTFRYYPGIYVQKFKDGAPQWSTDWSNKEGGVKITTNSTNPPSIAPSGDGGCVIAWLEKSGGKYKIKAAKLKSNGDFVGGDWGGAGGKTVRSDTTVAKSPKVVPTPDSGVWVVWLDYRDYNGDGKEDKGLSARKITSSGGYGSSEICLFYTPYGGRMFKGFTVTEDGNGGILVTWRYIKNDQYRCERVWILVQGATVSGKKWSSHIEVDSKEYSSSIDPDSITVGIPVIAQDGSGGCVCVWPKKDGSHWRLYAQRVSSNGSKLWGSNGVTLTIGYSDDELNPDITNSGDTLIATWHTLLRGNSNIRAQALDGSGNRLWNSGKGWTICNESGFQGSPKIIKSDNTGSGHCIIVWNDNRPTNNPPWNIYGERVRIDNGYEE